MKKVYKYAIESIQEGYGKDIGWIWKEYQMDIESIQEGYRKKLRL